MIKPYPWGTHLLVAKDSKATVGIRGCLGFKGGKGAEPQPIAGGDSVLVLLIVASDLQTWPPVLSKQVRVCSVAQAGPTSTCTHSSLEKPLLLKRPTQKPRHVSTSHPHGLQVRTRDFV